MGGGKEGIEGRGVGKEAGALYPLPPPHAGGSPGSHTSSPNSDHGCWAHGCTFLDFILLWPSMAETQLHQPALYPSQRPTQASTVKGNRTLQRPLGLGEDPRKDRQTRSSCPRDSSSSFTAAPAQGIWAHSLRLPLSTNPLLPFLQKSPLPPASPRYAASIKY